MRITQVEAIAVDAGPAGHLLVFVDTDEGVVGIGEAAMRPWRDAVAAAIGHLGKIIAGHDPRDTQLLWQLMARASYFPTAGPSAAALAAIDIALWDIRGKCLGVPVYQLLGGAVRDYVPSYVHASKADSEPDPARARDLLVAECRELVDAGWRHVRWGLPAQGRQLDPAASIRTAIGHAAALREALGQEVELLLDVHTRLDLPDAVRLCDELTPYRPFFVEDPMRVEHLSGYRRLRSHSHVPIAAGEHLTSKPESTEPFRAVIS